MLEITEYQLYQQIEQSLCIAVVADMHDEAFDEVIAGIKQYPVDFIAVAGDLFDSAKDKGDNALAFLRQAVNIATTVYTFGNHEYKGETSIEAIEKTGCYLLNNRTKLLNGVFVGGLSSKTDLDWLQEFAKSPGWKMLLCHHPEYYKRYLKNLKIDLIVAGHAHGGHIRVFNRGIYAIGQGPFPKYVSGVHDNRLVVSRGLGNHCIIPRIKNHPELVIVKISPNQEKAL